MFLVFSNFEVLPMVMGLESLSKLISGMFYSRVGTYSLLVAR